MPTSVNPALERLGTISDAWFEAAPVSFGAAPARIRAFLRALRPEIHQGRDRARGRNIGGDGRGSAAVGGDLWRMEAIGEECGGESSNDAGRKDREQGPGAPELTALAAPFRQNGGSCAFFRTAPADGAGHGRSRRRQARLPVAGGSNIDARAGSASIGAKAARMTCI